MTKEELIAIINTADYSTGDPIRKRKYTDHSTGDCDVVGAAIRAHYKTSNSHDLPGIADILTGGVLLHKHPVKLLAKGMYWSALAAQYDNLSYMEGSETVTPTIRAALVEFVTTYFPDVLNMPDFTIPIEYNNEDPNKNPPTDEILTFSSDWMVSRHAGWKY